MASSTTPSRPVENWESIRHEWVDEAERFVSDIEAWVRQEEWWGSKREPKEVDEERLGTYTLPRLLIRTSFGRFIIDPVVREVPLARGLFDISVLPSFDYLMIVRDQDGRWFLHVDNGDHVETRPWTQEQFVATLHDLSRLA